MSEVMPPPRTVAVRDEPTSLINIIARAMHDDSFDVNKLESLIRIQREIVQEQAQQEFNRAMSAAQSEMRAIRRDGKNDQTHSRYAKLETIDEEIRPIYTAHGFSLTFSAEPAVDPANIRVVCEIAHSGGHVKKLGLESPPDVMGAKGLVNKTALHGLGSTVSYLRRYLTSMIFNVVLYNEDDDGNGNRDLRQAAREEENARRAAALATQRGARKTGPAAPDGPATNGKSWVDDACDRLWVVHQNGTAWAKLLLTLLSEAPTEKDVLLLGDVTSIQDAINAAPPAVTRELTAAFGDAIDRFKPVKAAPADADAAGEPELAIEGERFAAG